MYTIRGSILAAKLNWVQLLKLLNDNAYHLQGFSEPFFTKKILKD